MSIYSSIIVALWLVFVVYWGVTAITAKRSIGRRAWWREPMLRLLVLALILFAFHVPRVQNAFGSARGFAANAPVTGTAGVGLCALGVALAIWARACLGRNWGMPMSRKEYPELVTDGPYAVVRHPIYTGMIVLMLGSALALSPFWFVPFFLFAVYFVYDAKREEALMIEQFPQTYPVYMRRTKMFIPFVI